MERQFLLAVKFIFPVPIILPHRAALFMTSLSTVINIQTLIWKNLLLVLSVLMKNKELKRDKYTTGMLEVNIMEFYLI